MKFIPHEYQKYAIDRVVADPALGLFLEMGLGKTVITLTAINELRFHRWAVSRCLVVAPKKVAEATWSAEAAQWDHLKHLRINPVLGSAQKRIQALNTPGDIWVINRENVPWLVDYYRNGWPFDMVVLDESSSFKNAQSKRFKALKLVRPRIARLVERAFLTPQQGEAVDPAKIASFFASPLGRELMASTSLRREFKFSILVPAADYYPQAGAEEQVLLQGVVDCCFETLEGITVVDFKTDRVDRRSVAARAEEYRPQLAAYSRALEEITGKPVIRRCLWFFALDQAVDV